MSDETGLSKFRLVELGAGMGAIWALMFAGCLISTNGNISASIQLPTGVFFVVIIAYFSVMAYIDRADELTEKDEE